MSSPNIELATRALEAWNTNDIDLALTCTAAGAELFPVITGKLVGEPYRGHDGLRAWFRDYIDVFDEFHVTSDEMRDFGDRVLMVGRVHAKGHDSGVELDQPFAFCAWFRDGLSVCFKSYLDVDAAREAAEKGEI